MRMVPYDMKKLNIWKKSGNFDLLMKFKESDMDCVKLENWTHVNAKSCQTSLLGTIKRYSIRDVKVVIRKEEVYLVKEKASM